jgi:hypothetical protein
MYNPLLNGVMIQQLREYVAGKKVLLVGNSATLFSDEHHGELIDSYDAVLRFGKGVPYYKYRKFLGSRKDIWFFGTARAGVWRHFVNTKFRVMTISQINLYKDDEASLLINKCLFDGSMQIYRDYMLAGDLEYTKQVARDIHGVLSEDLRLSQGVQAVHFFDKVVKSQASIDLIGFDFFEHEFKYHYDARNGSRIPKTHTIGSWHCPLTAPNFVSNPHMMSKELEYFRTVENLNIHTMPDHIDEVQIADVLAHLRGPRASLIGAIS